MENTECHNEPCPICFEPIVHDNGELHILDCLHTFHRECIIKWINLPRINNPMIYQLNTCPLCRTPVQQITDGQEHQNHEHITYNYVEPINRDNLSLLRMTIDFLFITEGYPILRYST
jgi:Ring finger domain